MITVFGQGLVTVQGVKKCGTSTFYYSGFEIKLEDLMEDASTWIGIT